MKRLFRHKRAVISLEMPGDNWSELFEVYQHIARSDAARVLQVALLAEL